MSYTIKFQQGRYPDWSYAGCIDTVLQKHHPTINYGSEALSDSGIQNDNTEWRYLCRFDLSRLPVTATVKSCTFAMLEGGRVNSTSPFGIRPLGKLFTELGATWNKYDGINDWTTPGGDFSGAMLQNYLTFSQNAWMTFGTAGQLNALIQGWINDPASNNGFMVYSYELWGWNAQLTCTRNHATPSKRPTLTVEYEYPDSIGAPCIIV